MCGGSISASLAATASVPTAGSSMRTSAPSTSRPASAGMTAATAAATPGTRASAASTSPSSMRYPLILIRWSARPTNSRVPSGRYRTRSPVRYQVRPPYSTNFSAVRSGLPRYPLAMPRPENHNSPGTQSGQSSPLALTTRQALFANGTPYGTSGRFAGRSRSRSSPTSKMVPWMAVSVAPPRPANRTCGDRVRRARTISGRTLSPPASTTRSDDRSPGTSTSISSQPGRKLTTDTRCSEMSRAQLSGSRRCSSSTTTTAPPARSVPNTSGTDMSDSRCDSASARSFGPMPKWAYRNSRVFMTASWVSSTPLGAPVEPEVKRMYARSWTSVPGASKCAGSPMISASVTVRAGTPQASSTPGCSAPVMRANSTPPVSNSWLARSAGWSIPIGR